MPTPPGWRDHAPPDLVVLAVGKCLVAKMDNGSWKELGLLTGTLDRLQAHGRLFRSLYFGDDDYDSCVYDVTPWVLDDQRGKLADPAPSLSDCFPNLGLVSDYLSLPAWLEDAEPAIYERVCTPGGGEAAAATMADGTVLSEAETAAARLEVEEMRRQIERIRRDYASDPESLIGQAKEMVETTCKTILGLTGTGPETQQEVPELVAATLRHLGLHPGDVAARGEDPAEAQAVKRILGVDCRPFFAGRPSFATPAERVMAEVVRRWLTRLSADS